MDDSSKQQMDPEVRELQVTEVCELQLTIEKSTILHMASKFGDEERTEQILRSHPSLVQEINMKGDTPLHIAARSGHLGVAKLLITCAKTQVVESGLHPLRMVNKKKLTVLQEAVRNNNYWVVDLLIKEDPGLTCTTEDGVESPLFMAVEGNFDQIAVRILETFPNCALSGRMGMTIMHAAVIGLANYSIHGAIKNTYWSSVFNPCSVLNSPIKGTEGLSFEFVDKVLKKIGPEILQEKDKFGWTPLHYAAYIGNKEVVKLFLETNSSLAYIKNKEGMSALHISAQKGRIGIIKILMQKCPNVCELLDNKDQTALHVAARYNNLDVLRTLLRMTCFRDLINEPDKEGNTFLHEAARHSNLDILMMLANDRRINKTAINNLGKTAGDIFQQLGRAWWKSRKKQEWNSYTRKKYTKHLKKQEKHQSLLVKKNESEYIKNVATVNLIVATIITSITFAAFLSMPGGYDNKNGMPMLRKIFPFRFFLVTNYLAFGFATSSMFIHFLWPLFSRYWSYPGGLVIFLTVFSIFCAVLALGGVICAVLTGKKTNTNSDEILWLLIIIGSFSFIIPIFYFFYSTNFRITRAYLRSVLVDIVEKFRK
ncbi:hypothetical protein UlMin_006207 [Ulmus minor]